MFNHVNQFKMLQFDEIQHILCFVMRINYEIILTYKLQIILEMKRLKLQEFNLTNDNMCC